jgi:hypothetical protein
VVIVKVLHAANVDGKKFGSRKVWLTSYDQCSNCFIFIFSVLIKIKKKNNASQFLKLFSTEKPDLKEC